MVFQPRRKPGLFFRPGHGVLEGLESGKTEGSDMKRLIALGILAGAGFFGYRAYESSTAPVKRYGNLPKRS
jgi:hypothetical protein